MYISTTDKVSQQEYYLILFSWFTFCKMMMTMDKARTKPIFSQTNFSEIIDYFSFLESFYSLLFDFLHTKKKVTICRLKQKAVDSQDKNERMNELV